MGLLISKGRLWGQAIRIKPRLCLTLLQGDFLVEVFDAAFAKV
jgi:hypothetical protein